MVAILINISIVIIKGQDNCNLKIAVHMSELSQMIELDNVSNSETPNLATLHRLACARSCNYTNKESLPEKLPFATIYGIMISCTVQTVKSS